MSPTTTLLLAMGIGIITGLRCFTGATVSSWAAYLGWLHLQHTPLRFLGSIVTVVIFTLLAAFELYGDKLPNAPNRTALLGLGGRIIVGGFCGLVIGVASGQLVMVSAAVAIAGALLGTFAGFQARTRLVQALKVPDYFVAVAEDLVAIAGGLWIVSRF